MASWLRYLTYNIVAFCFDVPFLEFLYFSSKFDKYAACIFKNIHTLLLHVHKMRRTLYTYLTAARYNKM